MVDRFKSNDEVVNRFREERDIEPYTTKMNKQFVSLPIQVPDGMAIIAMMCDDPLSASYNVFYRECRRRGIPITLDTPSIMSTYAPIGLEDFGNYYRMPNPQFSEILTRGGGCLLYHSTSHANPAGGSDGEPWSDFEALATWYANEVRGVDYLEIISAIVGRSDVPVRGRLTLGDIINKWLQTSYPAWEAGEYATNEIVSYIGRNWIATTTTSAVPSWSETDWNTYYIASTMADAQWVTAQGFMTPGNWSDPGASGWAGQNSAVFRAGFERWGYQFALYPGALEVPIPRTSQYQFVRGLPSSLNSTAANRVFIDNIITNEQFMIAFSHDWLDDGETLSTDGGGSAKSGNTAIQDSGRTPTYDKLIDFLNYIKTKVDAGELVALGAGAGMAATRGTPINIWPNDAEDLDSYMAKISDDTNTLSEARQLNRQNSRVINGSADSAFYVDQEWSISCIGKEITLSVSGNSLTTIILSRSADNETITMNDTWDYTTSNQVLFEIVGVSYPAWSSATYYKNDTVVHDGSYWVCTTTDTTDEPAGATDWYELTTIIPATIEDDEKVYLLTNRNYSTATQTQEHFGMWMMCDAQYANESYILSCYVRVAVDNPLAYPKIFIYGTSEEWPGYSVTPAGDISYPQARPFDIPVPARYPRAMFNNLLYEFTFDGIDCTYINYNYLITSVETSDSGSKSKIITNAIHNWDNGDEITITNCSEGTYNSTHTIEQVDLSSFVIDITFAGDDTGEAKDQALEWKKINLPFSLPKPIQRFIVVLSGTNAAYSGIHWSGPITVTPNGPGLVGIDKIYNGR